MRRLALIRSHMNVSADMATTRLGEKAIISPKKELAEFKSIRGLSSVDTQPPDRST